MEYDVKALWDKFVRSYKNQTYEVDKYSKLEKQVIHRNCILDALLMTMAITPPFSALTLFLAILNLYLGFKRARLYKKSVTDWAYVYIFVYWYVGALIAWALFYISIAFLTRYLAWRFGWL